LDAWSKLTHSGSTCAIKGADREPMKRPLAAVPSVLAVSAVCLAMLPATAGAAGGCTLVAAPWGSDGASGTLETPFRSAQKLVDSLAPGQTGCLRGGTYEESAGLTIAHGGTPEAPLSLEGYPGETATIVGRIWVSQEAEDVIVTNLDLDGVNPESLPSPTIDGTNITFARDEVSNGNTAICFDVGSHAGWGVAMGTVITMDRIHNCGVLPADNHEHAIYVEDAVGTQIAWNLIYANADRGIQLFPDAQDTTVDHNVIDGNGEGIIFSGGYGVASEGTNVYDNLLTGATLRHDAESWYPPGNPLGSHNLLHDNCLWGGKEGALETSAGGFSAFDNIEANPLYVDAAAHDYHLRTASPCLALTGDIASEVPGAATVETPAKHVKHVKHATRAQRGHRRDRRHSHGRRYRLR
jgi:Right handed beta helix region